MNTTTSSRPIAEATAPGRRRPLRHYVEMIVAMFVGMAVIGGAIRGLLGLVGVSYSTTAHPELSVLEMAFDMSVGMVVWMRYRGHGWAGTLEMVGAMFAPAIALLPALWVGVVGGESLMLLEHALMLPLMYVVMLRRRREYGGRAHE